MRAAFLGEPQLFRDEAASWSLARHSLGGLLSLSSHETFPPLYALLLKGWMALFGGSELALRSLSVVAGVGTVLVTWRWARTAVGPAGALAAAALVALSPALVLNSRDARMYSLETLFATGAWWLLWLLVAEGAAWSGRRRHAAELGLVLLVAGEVWTMSLGIPIAALQLLFAITALMWLRTRAAANGVGCVVAGGLSLAPWLPNLLSVAFSGQPFWTPRPDVFSLAATFAAWFPGDLRGASPLAVVLGVLLLAVIGALVFGAYVALGQATASHPGAGPTTGAAGPAALPPGSSLQRGRLLALALALGVGLVPVVWAYSQLHSIYETRYLGAAFPPLAIASGAALLVAAGRLRRNLRTAQWLPQGALAILLVVPIASVMAVGTAYSVDQSVRGIGIEPARQMAQELGGLAHPGDAIITLNAQTYFPLDYYLRQTGVAERLGIELFDWHRPSAAYFTGWMDIDGANIVDDAKVAGAGWSGALHLAPGGVLWCVTLVDPDREFANFTPLAAGRLRQLKRIPVSGGGLTGEIREAVPIGA